MNNDKDKNMDVVIFWSSKIDTGIRRKGFIEFAQRMAFRLIQGSVRYGNVTKTHMYMSRMLKEARAYKKTGNVEHLYNVANYCMLETLAPENSKFHFNNKVGSITRT